MLIGLRNELREAIQSGVRTPQATSALVGREAELAELVARLGAHRLVTLTGPGGIGKTRLGVAVAHALLPHYADGVWIAELGPLSDPQLVPVTVAGVLCPDVWFAVSMAWTV
jgi:predicted ATPase